MGREIGRFQVTNDDDLRIYGQIEKSLFVKKVYKDYSWDLQKTVKYIYEVLYTASN